MGAAAAFSVLGFYTSLTATFVGGTLDHHSRLLAGSVVFAVMGASAVAQIVFARAGARRRLWLAGTLMVVGLAGVALSAALEWLWLYVVGGVLAGAGVGLVFQAAIATAVRLAAPGQQAETVSGMFLAAYIGITVPVVGVGVALTAVGSAVPVLIVFALLVLVVVALAVAGMLHAQASAAKR